MGHGASVFMGRINSGRWHPPAMAAKWNAKGKKMANLGFIGLGVMGGQMVDRLLSKGHSVTGYNRTASKAEWLVKKGMKLASTPWFSGAQLAARSRLSNTPPVEVAMYIWSRSRGSMTI